MNNRTKKVIIGAILAGAIGGYIATGGGVVNLTIGGEYRWITQNQYKELRDEMITKYQMDEDFTWQEFQLLVAVLDKEAKRGKFKGIKNITKDNLIPKMIEKIK